MKYAKLPKKYRVTKKNPAVWRIVGEVYHGHLLGIRFPLWILRPICWIRGHRNKIVYPYGCKLKQCQRCAKVHYKKPTREGLNYPSGMIGELYGVRFISTSGENDEPQKTHR